MNGIPRDAVARVRRLASDLGRTPTQRELRAVGIWKHQKTLLVLAGLTLRAKGGWQRGPDGVTRDAAPSEPVVPAHVEDALGQRVARSRLALYRVPVNPASDIYWQEWMA